MPNELKPCPFCGCEYTKDKGDFLYSGDHEDWCPLNVKNNGCNVLVHDDPKSKDNWNTRYADTSFIIGVDLANNSDETVAADLSGTKVVANIEDGDDL